MFVPDEIMGHDFYKVANEIINHPHVQLELTIDGDDICKPCKKYQNICIDELTQIPGINNKDVYNKLLDTRIIELYQLQNDTITAFELCERFYQTHENIWQIWQEDDRMSGSYTELLFEPLYLHQIVKAYKKSPHS